MGGFCYAHMITCHVNRRAKIYSMNPKSHLGLVILLVVLVIIVSGLVYIIRSDIDLRSFIPGFFSSSEDLVQNALMEEATKIVNSAVTADRIDITDCQAVLPRVYAGKIGQPIVFENSSSEARVIWFDPNNNFIASSSSSYTFDTSGWTHQGIRKFRCGTVVDAGSVVVSEAK